MFVVWTPAIGFADPSGRTTGLPLPRFVSVKGEPANVRAGPGTDHPIKWTFVRRGLPLEVTAEFGNWRRVRDWEGEEGWMLGALLSGKRMGLVAPWSGAKAVRMLSEADSRSPTVVIVQPEVLVGMESCDGEWCEITAKRWRGYVLQNVMWGVYPGETF